MGIIFEWLKNRSIIYSGEKLITQVLIYSSYVNKRKSYAHDSRRPEFTGNAMLRLWTMKKLFLLEPGLSEGQVITLHTQLICEEVLTEYNRQLGLGRYLMLGVGEEKADGRQRGSILADMFEALPGAASLNQDVEVIDNILSATITSTTSHPKSEEVTDYKTKLQRYIQSDSRKMVHYETVNVSGPGNKSEFEVIVTLGNIGLGRGRDFSKKRAEQITVRDAFEKTVK